MDDVIDDRARLGEHHLAVANDRRLAERVNRLHRRRCRARRLTPDHLEPVFEPELFHEPHDALRARARQVMHGDHVATLPAGMLP
jgi:hypothetical protein